MFRMKLLPVVLNSLLCGLYCFRYGIARSKAHQICCLQAIFPIVVSFRQRLLNCFFLNYKQYELCLAFAKVRRTCTISRCCQLQRTATKRMRLNVRSRSLICKILGEFCHTQNNIKNNLLPMKWIRTYLNKRKDVVTITKGFGLYLSGSENWLSYSFLSLYYPDIQNETTMGWVVIFK